MEASEKKINEILTENKIYEIPPYQRPYSWEKSHARELIEDICQAYQRNDPEYFIGSIITIEKERNRRYEVVDGQQRLTTLNIIFAVIKQLITHPSSVEDIQKRIMPVNPYTDEPEQPRLIVRKQDQAFFQKYILMGEDISSAQEMSETQAKFYGNMLEIKQVVSEFSEVELRRLVNYILEHVYVVFVVTDNFTSAYRLFNVLNARGMSLSNGDLLKNRLFEYCESKPLERSRVEECWNELENIVGIRQLDNFLSHLRTSIKGNKQQEILYQEFDEILEEYKEAPARFAEFLLRSAHHYEKIMENDFDNHLKTQKLISSFHRVAHDEWIPPVLAFLNKPVPDMEFADFVELMEKITYQNWVRWLGKTKRNTVYYQVINLINKGCSADELIETVKKYADNKEFEQLIRADIYHSPAVKAILLRLEQESQDQSVVKQFHGRITVEHILPQKLKDEYWIQRFTPDVHQELVHKLGNLTLLSGTKNSAAQYYSFDRKKEIYEKRNKKVSFDLTKEILEEKEWTKNQILSRQEKLVKKAMEIWGIQ
ncbi:GmrSD restriction endonuclease domain-containing protein [Anoxybacillus flavithermus]|uniref:GmrSD restriction endonuclease domain-containing protein n=1 Tax=Anoxybacillus flavithermus TaxID=33934 RepID=UPI001865DE39|nr:DUF262 domain-containing protein [Anoxybacillus flavithermus]